MRNEKKKEKEKNNQAQFQTDTLNPHIVSRGKFISEVHRHHHRHWYISFLSLYSVHIYYIKMSVDVGIDKDIDTSCQKQEQVLNFKTYSRWFAYYTNVLGFRYLLDPTEEQIQLILKTCNEAGFKDCTVAKIKKQFSLRKCRANQQSLGQSIQSKKNQSTKKISKLSVQLGISDVTHPTTEQESLLLRTCIMSGMEDCDINTIKLYFRNKKMSFNKKMKQQQEEPKAQCSLAFPPSLSILNNNNNNNNNNNEQKTISIQEDMTKFIINNCDWGEQCMCESYILLEKMKETLKQDIPLLDFLSFCNQFKMKIEDDKRFILGISL